MLRATIAEAIGNLLGTRQRSALALLGIMIGAAAVIAMLNIGAIARNETVRQFQQMGIDILAIRAQGSSGFQLADAQAIPQSVPSIREVSPLVLSGGTVTFEGNAASATLVGVTASYVTITRLAMEQGRFISDLDKFDLYCVLGAQLAKDLSTPLFPLRLGSRLRVGQYVFTIIGIIAPAISSPMMPLEVNASLFMSIPNTRRALSNAQVSTVMARLAPGAEAESTANAVKSYLSPKLDTPPSVQSAQQLIAGMASQMRLFELLLGAIGAIALALGGVGVMNIMLVSVSERHREIGIRLAIGARRRDIQALFLSEAVLLSVLGGVLGIALGILASWVFARISSWQFILSAAAAPIGAGVSVAVGIFFGFYPAVMASRLDPIEALRSE